MISVRLSFVLSLLLVGCVLSNCNAQLPPYSVDDVGQGFAGFIQGINDDGIAVGHIRHGFSFQTPVIWMIDGQVVRQGLPTFSSLPDRNNGAAMSVNSAGVVAGFAEKDDGLFRAALWIDGGIVGNDEPPLSTNSYLNAINDSNFTVGRWDDLPAGTFSNSRTHAAMWNPDGSFVDLSQADERISEAFDINENNEVVGYSTSVVGVDSAMLWNSSGAIDLGSLTSAGSRAIAINDLGHIVGRTSDRNGANFSFLPWVWRDGVMTALQTMPGDFYYEPTGINNNGSVVGFATENGSFDQVSVIWIDEQIFRLDQLLPGPFVGANYPSGSVSFETCFEINDSGVVAVGGSSPSPFAATRPYLFEITNLGDTNRDGLVSLLDVALFVATVLEGDYLAEADVNRDNTVDLQDIAPFVELILN